MAETRTDYYCPVSDVWGTFTDDNDQTCWHCGGTEGLELFERPAGQPEAGKTKKRKSSS